MALRNIPMYMRAHFNVELEFMNVLNKNGFTDVFQASEYVDMTKHIDVFGTINCRNLKFDVKDLETKTYRNYSITVAEYDDIKLHPSKYKDHYLACKQYKNGKDTGKFIVIPTLSICNMMFKKEDANKKCFWLAPVYKYMNISSKYRILG